MKKNPYRYCYIFPELSDRLTFDEIMTWKNEVELIWKGYRVQWKQIANRQFGIICTHKEEVTKH